MCLDGFFAPSILTAIQSNTDLGMFRCEIRAGAWHFPVFRRGLFWDNLTARTHNAEVRKCWGSKTNCWMTQISSDLKGKLQGFRRTVLSRWWLRITPLMHKSANIGQYRDGFCAYSTPPEVSKWHLRDIYHCHLDRGRQCLCKKGMFSSAIQWISSRKQVTVALCLSNLSIASAACSFVVWIWADDAVWFAVLVCFSFCGHLIM